MPPSVIREKHYTTRNDNSNRLTVVNKNNLDMYFPSEDDIISIEDSEDEEADEIQASEPAGDTENVKLTSCRNPYHERWGNDDTNYRWPSQVPALAQSVFRILGYERAPGSRSKFCETCIKRATCLTPEEVTEIQKLTKMSRRVSENSIIQSQLEKLDKLDISDEEKAHQAKQLSMLAFKNPGKFMEDFDPEKSTREMKKVNRRIYKEKVARKNQVYTEEGLLISNSRDQCDCLIIDCPGCHFPCPKCQSHKCGADCRNSRRWIYEFIEIEGTGTVRSWPQA